jgi:hypothetical protein
MAVSAEHAFGMTPIGVAADRELSHGAVRLYTIMASCWWLEDGECRLSNATLAELMSCSDASLRRYIAELITRTHITARRAGRGQAKAYTPTARPRVNRSETTTSPRPKRSPVSAPPESNRPPVAAQVPAGERSNRSPAAPVKETPVKDLKTGCPGGPGSGPPGEAAAVQAPTPIRPSLSDGGRAVVAWWRECNDAPEPALNTAQARMIERAVAALGLEVVKASIQHLAEVGRPDLNKAINGAYTRAKVDISRSTDAGVDSRGSPPPRSAGPPPRVAPAPASARYQPGPWPGQPSPSRVDPSRVHSFVIARAAPRG